MELVFNIDRYKVNENILFIEGWIHRSYSKIIVVSSGETKVIDNFVPRHDITLQFNEEKTKENYGFKQEFIFSKKVKKAKVYIIDGNKRELMFKIDERRIALLGRKIKRILSKIKRGISFLWREYHFLVPPKMMIKYIKMIFEKHPEGTTYNPNIINEYNAWLIRHSKNKDKVSSLSNLTFLNEDNYCELLNIKTKYVCLESKGIEKNCNFFNSIKEELEGNYDLIYFDNDFIIDNVYQNPFFKPDFSPDTLLGVNYIGNMFIIKTSLLKEIKCSEFNLYKVLLSLLDKNISCKHISKILYHDSNQVKNGIKELKEYLKKKRIKANVHTNLDGICNTLEYIPSGKSMVSIIIPTKDHADILEACLKSVYEKTTYKNYEVIVIDNNSCEKETFDLLKKYDKKYNNFVYKRLECEFNYSYINNEAAKLAKGDYILLLNNDVEVITPRWLEIMLGYAEQKHIGTVGVKLIFPDETIQHAGIIMGKGGLAGHAHYAQPRNYIGYMYELSIPYNCSACTAACLLFARSKFEEVGGLEEKLKVAFNDVDFNLKVLDKGYYNIFLPNVELYHYESKSRGLDTTLEKQKRFMQEFKFIDEKWKKYIIHDPYYNDNFSKTEDYMII